MDATSPRAASRRLSRRCSPVGSMSSSRASEDCWSVPQSSGRAFSREEIGALTPVRTCWKSLDAWLLGAASTRPRLETTITSSCMPSSRTPRTTPSAAGPGGDARGFARWLDTRERRGRARRARISSVRRSTRRLIARERLAREAAGRLGRSGLDAVLVGDDAGARNLLERALRCSSRRSPEARARMRARPGPQGIRGATSDAVVILEGVEALARRRAIADSSCARRWSWRGRAWSRDRAPLPRRANSSSRHAAVLRARSTTLRGCRAEPAFSAGARDLMLKSDNRPDEPRRDVARSDARTSVSESRGGRACRVSIACAGRRPSERRWRSATRPARWRRPPPAQPIFNSTGRLRALRWETIWRRPGRRPQGRVSVLADLGDEAGCAPRRPRCFGSTEAFTGNWPEARNHLRVSVPLHAENSGNRAHGCVLHGAAGEAALARGGSDDARSPGTSRRRHLVGDDLFTEIRWRRVAAESCARRGHPRKASRLMREAVRDRRFKRRPPGAGRSEDRRRGSAHSHVGARGRRRGGAVRDRSRLSSSARARSSRWRTRRRRLATLGDRTRSGGRGDRRAPRWLPSQCGGHVPAGIRAGSPAAGAIVWNIAAPMTIVAMIAIAVRTFVNVASISVSPPLAYGGERPIDPSRLDHDLQTAR